MTNFTFNKSPIREIDDSVRIGTFSAVDELLRIYSSRIDSNNTNLESTVSDFEKSTINYNYDILLDRGNGRISRGLNSLLTLSRIISGKSGTSPMITSNPIIFSNPTAIRLSDKEGMRVIVFKNLGISELIVNVSTVDNTFLNNTLQVIDKIGWDVRRGVFIKQTYEKDMIARCKKLVRLSDKHVREEYNG